MSSPLGNAGKDLYRKASFDEATEGKMGMASAPPMGAVYATATPAVAGAGSGGVLAAAIAAPAPAGAVYAQAAPAVASAAPAGAVYAQAAPAVASAAPAGAVYAQAAPAVAMAAPAQAGAPPMAAVAMAAPAMAQGAAGAPVAAAAFAGGGGGGGGGAGAPVAAAAFAGGGGGGGGGGAGGAMGPLFDKYDGLSAEAQSLAPSVSAIPMQQQRIAQTQQTIQQVAGTIATLDRGVNEATKSINRNANPSMFRKMWRGKESRDKKVAVKQAELEGLQQQRPAAEQQLAQAQGQLAQEQQQLQQLGGCQQRTQQIAQEQEQLFRQAIDSSPPSAEMLGINNAKIQLNGRLMEVGAVSQQTSQCAQSFGLAAQHYRQALSDLTAASQMNSNAQTLNFVGGRSDFAEYAETDQQFRRDQAIKDAVQRCQVAQQQLAAAYQTVPPAARQRYPHAAGALGAVPLPQLQLEVQSSTSTMGMKFLLGDLGDAINDSQAGGKIQRNLQQVAQASAIAEQQAAQAQALHNACVGEQQQLQAESGSLDAQMKQAEQNLFGQLRAQSGH